MAPASTPSAAEDIAVHCLGSGEPLYLIGGGPAFTTWHLEPIQQQLQGQFRVCRWDMRGVGDNASLTIDPETPVLAQWLEDMAAVLPEQPTVLWGHSWGALQILLFTKKHPERVKALVLGNPVDPALKSLERIEAKRHVHDLNDAQLNLDDIGTAAEQRLSFRSKIASYFLDGETGWAYSGMFSAADTNNALNVQIWQDYRNNPLTDRDIQALADKVAAVIHCYEDVLMPESRQEYARLLPAEQQHMVSECAHFPWVETPDIYYDALLRGLENARQ